MFYNKECKEHKDKIKSLEKENKEIKERSWYEKIQLESRVKELESEIKNVIYKCESEKEIEKSRIRSHYIDKFKDKLVEYERRAIEAEAKSKNYDNVMKERDKTIDRLEDELKSKDDFIKFVLTKIPSVDLSKFDVNVEMPKPQVTVINKETESK